MADFSGVSFDGVLVTNHFVTLTDLLPDTRYYYALGDSISDLAGGNTNFQFVTTPMIPKRTVEFIVITIIEERLSLCLDFLRIKAEVISKNADLFHKTSK